MRARWVRSIWPSAYSDRPSLWWCCASWNSSTAGRASSSSWISRRWRITAGSSSCASGTRPSGACSTSRHVGDQHRVVRGHRAAAFGDDARRRQAVLLAGLGQRLHDAGGVLVDAVVDRAVAARTRAFVVDAQAAADVHVAHLARRARTARRSSASPRACRWRCRARWRSASPCGSAAGPGNPPCPASRSCFHRSSTWRGERPNLALSPPLFCHLPAPSEARRMRTPRPGLTPSARASSMTSGSSEGFSTTMKVSSPSLRPISARRMYSRSL